MFKLMGIKGNKSNFRCTNDPYLDLWNFHTAFKSYTCILLKHNAGLNVGFNSLVLCALSVLWVK